MEFFVGKNKGTHEICVLQVSRRKWMSMSQENQQIAKSRKDRTKENLRFFRKNRLRREPKGRYQQIDEENSWSACDHLCQLAKSDNRPRRSETKWNRQHHCYACERTYLTKLGSHQKHLTM